MSCSTSQAPTIAAGNGQVLFYRSGDGRALTEPVNPDGTMGTFHNVGPFTTGWTHITTTN